MGSDQFDLAERRYKKALEIRERLGLERDAAWSYHQLGMIAQQRKKVDLAEQWYKKALDTCRRTGLPSLMANSLAQMGVLFREQERLAESVVWFGKALAIATQYQMRVGGQILRQLAQLMKLMGENEFAAVWLQAFGEVPPLNLLREVMKQA